MVRISVFDFEQHSKIVPNGPDPSADHDGSAGLFAKIVRRREMIGVCMRFEQIQKIKLLGLYDSHKRIGSCRAGARDSGPLTQHRSDYTGRLVHSAIPELDYTHGCV